MDFGILQYLSSLSAGMDGHQTSTHCPPLRLLFRKSQQLQGMPDYKCVILFSIIKKKSVLKLGGQIAD